MNLTNLSNNATRSIRGCINKIRLIEPSNNSNLIWSAGELSGSASEKQITGRTSINNGSSRMPWMVSVVLYDFVKIGH